jgi:hypothetical protein
MEFNDAKLPTGRLCVVFVCRAPPHVSQRRDMQITISRKQLFALFVGFTLIILGGLLNACLPSAGRTATSLTIATAPPKSTSTSAAEVSSPDAPEQAAARILRTFYTADYRHQDQWLAALKPLSSADGYSLLENMIAPALWKDLVAEKTVVAGDQITVEDGGLIAEGVSKLVGNTPWQIRHITITLAPAAQWPGWTSSSYATNVLLSHEPDGWKFVMLLSDDQAEMFTTQPKGVK